MAFLTIDGWDVPVTNASPRRRLESAGAKPSRSFRGMMRDPRRGVRRVWDVAACFLNFDEADALIHLIQGEGHLISFRDGFQASTGLMPEPGHELILVDPDGTNPFGGQGCGFVHDGTQGQTFLQYDAQLGPDWTLTWWDLLGSWKAVTKRSDGAAWIDGARDDTAGSVNGPSDIFVDVAGGIVSFMIDNPSIGGSQAIDDLTIMPWLAPESMILSWHAMADPFGPFPVLRVTGDIVADEFMFCCGEVTGIDYIQKPSLVPGIGWVNNAKIVKFNLMEVPDGFVADADVPGRDDGLPTQGTVTP